MPINSKTKTRVGPLIGRNGETVKDPFLIAELLNNQYESTFSDPDTENVPTEGPRTMMKMRTNMKMTRRLKRRELKDMTRMRQLQHSQS